MKRANFYPGCLLAGILIFSQVSLVSAAPLSNAAVFIRGVVETIALETDPNSGVTTVMVTIASQESGSQTVQISQESAIEMRLVTLDVDGNPVINEEALGWNVQIDPASIIGDEEKILHPVGSALATFFSDIPGLDYDTIMNAREDGSGFGLIAQALWLTRKLGDADATVFLAILEAKKEDDYSAFAFDDGTIPLNWGQFKKTILSGEKTNLGLITSNDENDSVGNNPHDADHGNGNNQDRDKNNNGNGGGNGNGNGSGGGNGNGNGNGSGGGNGNGNRP